MNAYRTKNVALLFCIYHSLCLENVFCLESNEKQHQVFLCPKVPLKQYWDDGCKTCTDCQILGQPTREECGVYTDEVCDDSCIDEDKYFDALTKTCWKKPEVIPSPESLIGAVEREQSDSNKARDKKDGHKVENHIGWASVPVVIVIVVSAIGLSIWLMKKIKKQRSSQHTVEDDEWTVPIAPTRTQGQQTTVDLQEDCNQRVQSFDRNHCVRKSH